MTKMNEVNEDDRSTVLDESEYHYREEVIEEPEEDNIVEQDNNNIKNVEILSNKKINYKPNPSEEEWYENMKLYENFILNNGKKPSVFSELHTWFNYNIYYYKNNLGIMKNIEISNKFNEIYQKYDKLPTVLHNMYNNVRRIEMQIDKIENENNTKKIKPINYQKGKSWFTPKRVQNWNNIYSIVKEYIIKEGKVPMDNSNIPNARKISSWIRKQNYFYKRNSGIMVLDEIKEKWSKIYDKYYYVNKKCKTEKVKKTSTKKKKRGRPRKTESLEKPLKKKEEVIAQNNDMSFDIPMQECEVTYSENYNEDLEKKIAELITRNSMQSDFYL